MLIVAREPYPLHFSFNYQYHGLNEISVKLEVRLLVQDEARDGLGGGFLERQERASAATVEVTEDGFDDFGRKKAAKSADKAAKEAAALARLQASYGG